MKEKWFDHHDYKVDQVAFEKFICLPHSPFFSGRLDAIVRTSKGYRIVEFKGHLDPENLKPAPSMK